MASSTVRFLTNAFKGVFGGRVAPRLPDPSASRRSPLRRKPLFEGLEHRLLLSADPVGALGADPTGTGESIVTAPIVEEIGNETAAPPIVTVLPVAEDNMYIVEEDGVLQVAAPPALLTATLETLPENGELELFDDGSFVYRPAPNYSGPDGFTYLAQRDDGSSQTVAVQISVEPVNDAPDAQDDSFSTAAAAPLRIGIDALLANDSDVDGDTLTWDGLAVQPEHGVLEETYNEWGSLDGFLYRPHDGFVGEDTFAYTVKDRDGSDALVSAPAQVVIRVGSGNAAPTAHPDSFATDESTELVVAGQDGLLANDSDPDGDALTVTLVDGPLHGSLALDTDGGFTYTPYAGYSGQDWFSYRAGDGELESDVVVVTIDVVPGNRAPEFIGEPDTTFTIDGDAGFDSDGVFRVTGAPGQMVRVELDWTFREAAYNNEVGIYRVSDSDGRVGGLLPGTAGYAHAALAAGNAHVVFASGAGAGAHASLDLQSGALYAFYIIQNGKTSTLLSSNPDNKVDGRPLAFFSIAAANPDKFDHAHASIAAQTGLLNLRWEDLTGGGDIDLNDVVMTVAGLAPASDKGVYVYDASAQDADGDALTYSLVDGPQGAWIDAHTGVLSWAAAPGTFHFVIEANDGKGGVTEQAFDLTVVTRTTDLVVQGTSGKDRIEVSERDGLVTVRLNDVARVYSHVSSLRIEALGGDDSITLRGLTVHTTADGGDGNDCIDASAVTACGVVLYGGAGNDWLTGGAGDDRIDGGAGDDQLSGGSGNDLLVGGPGRDALYGGDGNDLLDGGSGNDQLRGGRGNDLLIAEAGDDYLKGEDGNDILIGGAGNDSSQGNYGADLIVDGPGCDSNGSHSGQDRVVSGSAYGIPTTLPEQPPGPVIDWGNRYAALVGSLQQFRDHPSNPQWWESFVNHLGQTDTQSNPNSQIRVVGPGNGL